MPLIKAPDICTKHPPVNPGRFSVQNQGTHEAALGQNCLPDQNGC